MINVYRNASHPWRGSSDWDQMVVQATDGDHLERLISDAENKFWHVWIRDQDQNAAVMYKPHMADAQWHDEQHMGTPRELCVAIAVGEDVYTDFTGKVTKHRVTARKTGQISQTGCLLQVTPVVAKSTDFGSPYVGSNPWIDAAWFRPVATPRNVRHE